MFKRLFVFGAALASAGAAVGFVKIRAQFRTWGIAADEAGKPLPGDDLVPNAEAVDTRGIDIDAPPEAVWPWLVQMGYGRAGWYSYDELDMDRPSADRVLPELQKLEVGDILPTHPGGGFEVRVLEPPQALVLYSDTDLVRRQAEAAKASGQAEMPANLQATSSFLSASQPMEFAATWAFILEPLGDARTRLIERFRVRFGADDRPWTKATLPVVGFGVFLMVRRQLLGLRDRVEGMEPEPDVPEGVVIPARNGTDVADATDETVPVAAGR